MGGDTSPGNGPETGAAFISRWRRAPTPALTEKARRKVADVTVLQKRPTDSDLARATARRLAELHTAGAHELSGRCWWCLKAWPCPDKVWIERVLRSVPFPEHEAPVPLRHSAG